MWMKDVNSIFSSYAIEFVSLLIKFEVVYKLDARRIVIPSLLPDSEEDACLVYSKAMTDVLEDSNDLIRTDIEGYDNIGQLDMPIFCRYYILPFIPNGFFTRLIARLMSSDVIDQLHKSLKGDPLETVHIANTIHWSCWRNGIVLVWNHKEIFRVAPLPNTNPSESKVVLITKKTSQTILSTFKGLEIKVAVIPEQKIRACTFLEPALQRMSNGREGIYSDLSNPSKGKCIVAWLLYRATSLVDSVLKDWYDGFGANDFEEETNYKMSNYCSQCLLSVYRSAYTNVIDHLYMFTSKYCCLAACRGESLECPVHGKLNVEDVAPDLVCMQL